MLLTLKSYFIATTNKTRGNINSAGGSTKSSSCKMLTTQVLTLHIDTSTCVKGIKSSVDWSKPLSDNHKHYDFNKKIPWNFPLLDFYLMETIQA